jgi:thiol-disulfide isomerase/thioredoxin
MRPIIVSFFILLTTTLVAQPTQSNEKAVEVLENLLAKLASYETMSYNYYRSLNYFSENYHSETEGKIFLDFRSKDTALGFRYQAENKNYKSVYNGSETFYLDKDDTTIKVSFKAQIGHFELLPLFTNSIITLKNALPHIINDGEVVKKLADTTIETKSYYLASFVLQNKTLSSLGNFDPISLKRDFFYKIVIDKTTFLPLQIIRTNSAEPKDYILTSFSNLKPDISQLPENSWYYSTYMKDFKPSSDKTVTLIKKNAMAPDWEANYFKTNEAISLSKLKGKVVLLEFWIKNCGNCITAVPELNYLNKKYRNNNLIVIGINRHDKQEDVNFFYQKNKPHFNTVIDTNGNITTAYGVDGFPTIVLIDKKGIVLYAGSFNKELIDGLLKTALK